MLIHDLRPAEGSNRGRKRLGRGTGSGLGTEAGKGTKGQKARSGKGKIRAGFEGGQMPIHRRYPKRGFSNARFENVYDIVNLSTLDKMFNAGDIVNKETMMAKGLARRVSDGIKVLGNGELSKKLILQVAKISKSAEEKVQKSGGTIEKIVLEKNDDTVNAK